MRAGVWAKLPEIAVMPACVLVAVGRIRSSASRSCFRPSAVPIVEPAVVVNHQDRPG